MFFKYQYTYRMFFAAGSKNTNVYKRLSISQKENEKGNRFICRKQNTHRSRCLCILFKSIKGTSSLRRIAAVNNFVTGCVETRAKTCMENAWKTNDQFRSYFCTAKKLQIGRQSFPRVFHFPIGGDKSPSQFCVCSIVFHIQS